jgi:hypothetical protein
MLPTWISRGLRRMRTSAFATAEPVAATEDAEDDAGAAAAAAAAGPGCGPAGGVGGSGAA